MVAVNTIAPEREMTFWMSHPSFFSGLFILILVSFSSEIIKIIPISLRPTPLLTLWMLSLSPLPPCPLPTNDPVTLGISNSEGYIIRSWRLSKLLEELSVGWAKIRKVISSFQENGICTPFFPPDATFLPFDKWTLSSLQDLAPQSLPLGRWLENVNKC